MLVVDGRVLYVPRKRKVLVCGDDGFLMQAIVEGVLELGEEFLSLREGSALTPVAVPFGTTVVASELDGFRLRVGDREFGLGERVSGSGGHVRGDASILPRGVGLTSSDEVVALQAID